MQRLSFALVLAASLGTLTTTAFANPNVKLALHGSVAERDAKGTETLTPIAADTALKPGQVVRYDIVATNAGTSPAFKLAPVDRVPSGTSYVAGTASSSPALAVEFSLDGGKTWAKTPTIKVSTQSGIVEKKADPTTYTAIRWIMEKPLDPKASVTYSYEVRVK